MSQLSFDKSPAPLVVTVGTRYTLKFDMDRYSGVLNATGVDVVAVGVTVGRT